MLRSLVGSEMCIRDRDFDTLKHKTPYSVNVLGNVAVKRRRPIEKGSLQTSEQLWSIPVSIPAERLTLVLTSDNHLGYSIQGCEFEADTKVKGQEIPTATG